MSETSESARYDIHDLLRIMERLRDPEHGCPWDLQQTFSSIAPYTLEECYELIDALERGDLGHVEDELGDVLFQVVFYSQLGREQDAFDFQGVTHRIASKLLRRHPHVFAGGKIEGKVSGDTSIEAIKANWEATKTRERAGRQQHAVLDDIPKGLPALSRAQKVQKRAASVGFDWTSLEPVLLKLEQEIAELREACVSEDPAAVAHELGDVLFSAVNVARHLGSDAEQALRTATQRFESRFNHMESCALAEGSALALESSDQLERRWEDAKRELMAPLAST